MPRMQSTDRDYQGNKIIHAKLDPLGVPEPFSERGAWAPWTDINGKTICWYDEDGNTICTAKEEALSTGAHTVGDLTQLPADFPLEKHFVMVDFIGLTADIDLSNWIPNSARSNAVFRFRKMDNTEYKITFTDEQGIVYNFVNRRGEFITLYYDGEMGKTFIG